MSEEGLDRDVQMCFVKWLEDRLRIRMVGGEGWRFG